MEGKEKTIQDVTLEEVVLASPIESKKGECKYLTFYGNCKLGHNECNEDMCIDCEDYEEVE